MGSFLGSFILNRRAKFDPLNFTAEPEMENKAFIRQEKIREVSNKNIKFMSLVGKAKNVVADLVDDTSPNLATKIRSSVILDKEFQQSVKAQKSIDKTIDRIKKQIVGKPHNTFLNLGLNALSLTIKAVNEVAGPNISSSLNRKAMNYLRNKEEQLVPLNSGLKNH